MSNLIDIKIDKLCLFELL